MSERWTLLTTVYTGLDVDIVKAALEVEGILVLVKGYQVGMWGSGFQGSISEGAEILVPDGALERARELWPDAAPEGADDTPADQ